MSGADLILSELRKGGWKSTNALLAASFRRRDRGLIVHSRIAELRNRGHWIECECRVVRGERVWFYSLLSDAASQMHVTGRVA